MTVEQLISELQTLPPNLLVLVDGYEGGFCDIDSLKTMKVELNFHSEDYYGPHEETDKATVPAVKIIRTNNLDQQVILNKSHNT